MFDYKIKHLIYIIMVVVALIKKNRCNFDDIEQYAEPLLEQIYCCGKTHETMAIKEEQMYGI